MNLGLHREAPFPLHSGDPSMRPVPSVPLLAAFLAACSPSPRTPPAADEPQQASSPPSESVDTGTSAAVDPSAAPGISSDDGQQVTALARWPGPPPAETQDALLDGTLVSQGGCLWVVPQSGPRYAVIWPAHVELASGAAPARVTDRQSGAAAQVGGRLRLTGGEVPAGGVGSSLPRGCRGPLWLAAGIVP